MKYKPLRNMHAILSSREEFERERQWRADGPTSLKTGVAFGESGSEETPLFMVEFPELSILQNEVLSTDYEIREIMFALPRIASQKYIHEILLEEMYNTNIIEGVRSSRVELESALSAAKKNKSKSNKRFAEMARMYWAIGDEEICFPAKTTDFRQLYDRLVGEEIEDEDGLDGEIFRAKSVGVYDGQKEIHRGVNPETAIVSKLGDLIRFSDTKWSRCYKSLAMHYVFEYIHPFYDGNGRIGRFLLALALWNEGMALPGIFSFSHEINNNRDAYYHAFSQVQEPFNSGELSFFVYSMLVLYHEGQKKTLADLTRKSQELSAFYPVPGFDAFQQKILDLTAQATMFSMGKGITLNEMLPVLGLGISKQTLRTHTKALEEQGAIELVGHSPLSFVLTAKFKEDTLKNHLPSR